VVESCLGVSDVVSVVVFHQRPRSPTVGFGAPVLSLVVIAWRR